MVFMWYFTHCADILQWSRTLCRYFTVVKKCADTFSIPCTGICHQASHQEILCQEKSEPKAKKYESQRNYCKHFAADLIKIYLIISQKWRRKKNWGTAVHHDKRLKQLQCSLSWFPTKWQSVKSENQSTLGRLCARSSISKHNSLQPWVQKVSDNGTNRSHTSHESLGIQKLANISGSIIIREDQNFF